MPMQESGEMYLETIYILSLRSSAVRSVDVGEYMGYSKPSVSRAIGLLKRDGLDALPEPLRDAALLRLANPEASLSDLALLSSPPVTKSCLSHRLNKIILLAEEDAP